MEENTDFTSKVSDKLLRSKCEKLEVENPNDANTLKIVLGQKMLSQAQRTWLSALIGRRGAKFVFVEPKKIGDKSPKTPAVKSGDVPLNSKK